MKRIFNEALRWATGGLFIYIIYCAVIEMARYGQ